MAPETLLDVSMLEPPEPMERVLAAVDELQPGDYLHLLHRREPFPLYPILEEMGFAHMTRTGRTVAYEVFVWRRGDLSAEQEARQNA